MFWLPEADLPLAMPLVSRQRHPGGTRTPWRQSDGATLLHPCTGAMTLHTRTGSWTVSDTAACWLPAGQEYRIETTDALEVHAVSCPGLQRLLPDRCGVVPISSLLRELISALADAAPGPAPMSPAEQMLAALSGQLRLLDVAPLRMPTLSSPGLLAIGHALTTDPCDSRTLAEWARQLGTTTRTLARTFRREAGMTFKELRRLIRLQTAVRRLQSGHSVTSVAYDAGFQSAASFIASFRQVTGTTPGRYLRAGAGSAARAQKSRGR